MKMNKIASIQIWNKKIYIGAVLNFLDAITSNHSDMEYGRYSRLRYVVAEVLENRIKKAYPNGEGLIDVELFLSESCFEVSIKDMGVPAWTDFSYDENLDIHDSQGLRNYILDMWMDGVGMEKLGKNGQRIYIRQKIKNPIAFKKPEPYQEIEVLDTNITIRPVVTEEDAIEAIRCIYSEYGYAYGYERLYYQDSFLRLIKNGDIMSFLAVNDHGQTAGHFALTFSDMYKNMPEMSTVVIRKEFRGLRLFSEFIDYSIEVGKKHKFRALMAQPVAYHVISQKAFLRAEFTATSLLMAYLHSDMGGAYGGNQHRLDISACVKILDENAFTEAYPPEELKGFIVKEYERLGCKYELHEASGPVETTQITVEDNSALKMKKIVLREAAEDLEQILKNTVKDTIHKKNEMVEMLIALNHPSCAYGYEIAKKCNFLFSGIIPGAENGDYLVMQRLIGEEMRYDQLVTTGEFEELKNDIVEINKNRKVENNEF